MAIVTVSPPIDPKNSLFQQAIVNGNFDVWQRGTSIANTAANSYTADRWYVDTATAGDDKTVSQQTSDVNGSKFSCRVQRVNGETGHTVLRLSQALESQDSIKFRGQQLTLSFYLKVGANFSATSNVFTAKILTGKGTDEKATAFTTSADAASLNITATTSSVRYNLTTSAVIASDITQIGVSFSFDPTGTAGANDWFEINQVQLNVGSIVLAFQSKSYETELRDCKRYCQMITTLGTNERVFMGIASATTKVQYLIPFRPAMRITPTLTATAADWRNSDTVAATDVTALALSASIFNSSHQVSLDSSVASGMTVNRPYFLEGDGNAGRIIIFDAEI